MSNGELFAEDAEEVASKKRMKEQRARLDARQKMLHKMGISKYFFHALGNRKFVKVGQRGG